MAEHDSALAQRAQAVANAPSDLTEWLRLAEALAAAGHSERAARAFEALGTAANELGQVALAVAASRWLDGAGASQAAQRLVGLIAATHCAESARIDRSSRPRPPSPPRPPAAAPADDAVATGDELAAVDAALDAAERAAKQRISESLPPTPLVNGLSAAEIERLIEVTVLSRRTKHECIVDVGEAATTLFWLASGLVAATRGEALLGELPAGSFFGEIGLVLGARRTARVTCVEDCWLLEIPARKVEEVAQSEPHLAAVLARYARDRLLANVMRTSEIFRRIDSDERRSLLMRFERQVFQPGDKIVAEGDRNERLHVIVSGACAVYSGGESIAELSAGDGFGEISLLSRRPAMADVVATEGTVTLSLTRQAFDDVAVEHPELLAEVYKLLVAREKENQAIFHDATDLIL